MKVFKELATLLDSFKQSCESMFWCFVMLVFLLYIFALIVVQGMSGLLLVSGASLDFHELTDIEESFGSVSQTMLTLYMSVTGGDDWSMYYQVASLAGAWYSLLFIFFTFFFTQALFNILAGVFVQKALLASKPDRDDLVLDQIRKRKKEEEEFRQLCRRLDQNNDGISYPEFVESMSNELMVSYMSSVGLEVHDVELFFRIVAGDCSLKEVVDIDQFVAGCMTMRGSATALDMRKQMFEMNALSRQLKDMKAQVETLSEVVTRQKKYGVATSVPRREEVSSCAFLRPV
jgi:hypothetical protein